jgi:hypothetical protein
MVEFNHRLLITLHFLTVELSLGVAGFFGSLLVWTIAATTGWILQLVAVVLALACWLLLVCMQKGGAVVWENDKVEKRGDFVVRAYSYYFVASFILHAILLARWAIFAGKFNVDPINETTNVGAFVVQTDSQLLMVVTAFVMLFFWLNGIRTLAKK